MRVKAGARSRASCPLSSSDEPTGLFLSSVASPQSRPPLHPMHSTYKPPHPTQVCFPDETQDFFYSLNKSGVRRNSSSVCASTGNSAAGQRRPTRTERGSNDPTSARSTTTTNLNSVANDIGRARRFLSGEENLARNHQRNLQGMW